jgi:hypothetical protein
LLEDGNPIAWHDCYSRDSTIEEIKEEDDEWKYRSLLVRH